MPADQLTEPVQPGQHVHLRLISTPATLFGLLPNLPELSWEDFEEASRAAVAGVGLSLVTRDGQITASGLVRTIW